MNLKQLTRQLGTNLRMRPLPMRLAEGDVELPPLDDFWRLEEVLYKPSRLKLLNIHPGHLVEIQSDNIKEYRSPDFLLLRCLLTLTPTEVRLEPLASGYPNLAPPPAFKIERPLGDQIAGEWIALHGTGAPVGWKVLIINWVLGSRCWVQPGEVEPDSHGDWVHPSCNLRAHRERYVYAIAVHPDDLDRFRRMFAERIFKTIPELEGLLRDATVKYVLSRRKRLLKSAV